MAGEVYTTFAFLGASGWAYSRGGPMLYILTYMSLAYAISFFILLWARAVAPASERERCVCVTRQS